MNGIFQQIQDEFSTLKSKLENCLPKYANHIIGTYNERLCPEIQFIGIEALKPQDIPYNISENGVYIRFKIDFINKSVEVFTYGHVYLSREEQDATNLAMASIKRIAVARNVKWFRKQKYKSIDDLYKRITDFYERAMSAVNDYTQGYPFKQGIGWV